MAADRVGARVGAQNVAPVTRAALVNREKLPGLVRSIVENGERDLLFAHVLMPHAPFLVDPGCVPTSDAPSSAFERSEGGREAVTRFIGQVGCAESIVLDVVQAAGTEPVVVITGDHGITSGVEGEISARGTADLPLFERLNVFMAYRFADQCREPLYYWTVALLEATLECVVDTRVTPPTPEFSLFADDRGRDWSMIRRIPDDQRRHLAQLVRSD